LKLAAQLPVLNYACGLATSALMKADVGVIPIENGAMSVSTPEISREMLEKLKVSQERLEWWRNRITEAWRLRGAK
jgi:O-succinylbenzoate synthase